MRINKGTRNMEAEIRTDFECSECEQTTDKSYAYKTWDGKTVCPGCLRAKMQAWRLADGTIIRSRKQLRKEMDSSKNIIGIPNLEEYNKDQEELKMAEPEPQKVEEEPISTQESEQVDQKEPEENPVEKVVEETKEQTKVIGKEVKVDRKAVEYDDPVTEITGTLESIELSDDIKTADLVVKDIDGNFWEIQVTNRGNIWQVLYEIDSRSYIGGVAGLVDMTKPDLNTEIERLLAFNKVIIFRCEKDLDEKYKLYTAVSLKYRKQKIEDVLPAIKEVFPHAKMDITGSTGKHGGSVVIEAREDEVVRYEIIVDGGYLDGGNSINLYADACILVCKNQMRLEVSGIFKKKLPGFTVGARSVHAGDLTDFQTKLSSMLTDAEEFNNIINEARSRNISPVDASKILDFYVAVGTISKKTRDIVISKLGDREIEQDPGTVWGLAMLVTYVGTHESSLRPGVRYSLKTIGGELVIVNSIWDQFMEEVVSRVKPEEPVEKEIEFERIEDSQGNILGLRK